MIVVSSTVFRDQSYPIEILLNSGHVENSGQYTKNLRNQAYRVQALAWVVARKQAEEPLAKLVEPETRETNRENHGMF